MEREASLAKTRSDPDGLATLLPKMADDLTRLLDTKLALLKIELKEELTTYVRGSAMIEQIEHLCFVQRHHHFSILHHPICADPLRTHFN